MSKEKKLSLEERIQAESTAYARKSAAEAGPLAQWQRDRIKIVAHPWLLLKPQEKRGSAA